MEVEGSEKMSEQSVTAVVWWKWGREAFHAEGMPGFAVIAARVEFCGKINRRMRPEKQPVGGRGFMRG
jgi:hypothetical protein